MIKNFVGLLFLGLAACSTVGNVTENIPFIGDEKPVRYSENPQMTAPSNRQYKRMTKNRMEEEADLGSQAGSMWIMDGQASYLFTQNKTRRDGDVLNVKLEGPAQKQVETKVKVIKKLLKQIEEQERLERGEGKSQGLAGDTAADGKDRAPASTPKPEEKEEKADLTEIATIPARIIEKLPDGNYRVKGAQPFMIDKKEYRVIVTGMIRPEDYNDEGVSSSKLLDPQFDVVSIRRNKNASETM
jgi:flagellar L-ring protein precursor FlgH